MGILREQNVFNRIKPVNFITLATPHMGRRSPFWNPSILQSFLPAIRHTKTGQSKWKVVSPHRELLHLFVAFRFVYYLCFQTFIYYWRRKSVLYIFPILWIDVSLGKTGKQMVLEDCDEPLLLLMAQPHEMFFQALGISRILFVLYFIYMPYCWLRSL